MAIAAQNGWSIAEALKKVAIRDELFYIHEAAREQRRHNTGRNDTDRR